VANLIEHAVRRPVAVAMGCMVVLITGIFSLTRLPLELRPDVSFPRISIQTQWVDTAPEVVEAFVTSPIEAVANTVTHVHEVESVSDEGFSTVTVKFNRGTDMDFAALELNEKLSIIRQSLPVGVTPPRITPYVPREFQTRQFFSLRLTGPCPLQEVRRIGLDRVKPSLLGLKGVSHVEVVGGQDREIQILLDEKAMHAYGLTLNQIQSALGELALRRSVGAVEEGRHRITVFIDNPVSGVRHLEDAILLQKNGSLIRLKDVAQIKDTYGRPRNLQRINGHPAVVIRVEKEAGHNTIKVVDEIKAALDRLVRTLPPNLTLIVDEDQSLEIRENLSSLGRRAVFSILVIFWVLMAFLHTPRAPLIILSTIFFSVLFTLNLFFLAGISLNLLTLAGLTLGFGMLVDNAIVVVENIARHHTENRGPELAASRGTREVVLPITAATLTTIAAFIPFLYLTGELRIYYLPFTLAVGFSLLSSLGVAFTLTPALAARKPWLKSPEIEPFRPAGWFRRILGWMLHHRGFMLFLALFVMGGSLFVFDKYVTRGTIWQWGGQQDRLTVYLRMPRGSTLERSDEIISRFETPAVQASYVQKVMTNVSDEGAYLVITFPREVRRSVYPLILKESMVHQASLVAGPGISISGFGEGVHFGGGAGRQFTYRIRILGYNYHQLEQIAEDLGQRLKRYPRVRHVNTNLSWTYGELSEIVLRIDRKRLRQCDLSPAGLLQQVQAHLQENLGGRWIRLGGEEVPYTLKFRTFRDFSMDDLQNLVIQSPKGELFRLHTVARIDKRATTPRIQRSNQQYERSVGFEYRGPMKLGQRLVDSVIETTHLPPGYSLESGYQWRMSEEEKEQIYVILAVSLFLVFLVTAGLFESLLHPFLILLTVPLSLAGVFLIFFLTNTAFDRSAYIGVVLLCGIVVNDSILLVDHINQLRRQGKGVMESVIQGTTERLRPILMTTFTTIGGLLPLILLSEGYGDIWYSLALATIGGLISSTLMVLTVIPVMYVSVERGKAKMATH